MELSVEDITFKPWEWSYCLSSMAHKYPHRIRDFAEANTERQWRHKFHLLNNLMPHLDEGMTIWLLGSWYGHIIPPYLYKRFKDINVIYIDFDHEAMQLSWTFDNHAKKRYELDINFELLNGKSKWLEEQDPPDVVINTACEHMWHMRELIFRVSMPLLAFQTNNFRKEEAHVNCCDTMDEFKEQTGITDVVFESTEKYAMEQFDWAKRNDEKYVTHTLIGYHE